MEERLHFGHATATARSYGRLAQRTIERSPRNYRKDLAIRAEQFGLQDPTDNPQGYRLFQIAPREFVGRISFHIVLMANDMEFVIELLRGGPSNLTEFLLRLALVGGF